MGDIELEPIISSSSVEAEPPEEEKKPLVSKGIQLYLLAIFTGSVMTATSKYSMQDADQNIVAGMRMIGTFIAAMLCMLSDGTEYFFWGPYGLRRILFVRGLVGTLNLACVYYAVQYMPLPDYSVICFLTPLATAAAAHFILGEPYHFVQAIASVVSLVGVIIITRPSFLLGHARALPLGVPPWRYYSAVICVLLQNCGTTTILLLLRKIGGRISPFCIMSNYALQTVVFSAGGLAVSAISSPTSAAELFPSKATTWIAMSALGIFGFLYQYFLTVAVTAERASVLTQFDYVGLLFAMLWQFLVWHTLPDLVSILGSCLILAGVWWASRNRQA